MLSEADILARRDWIGASELAAICGVNPYAGALDVYLSKVLEGTDLLEHARRLDKLLPIRIGNAIEGTLLDLYEERHSRKLQRNVRVADADLAPHLRATLDGWDDEAACPVEVKWAGSRTAHHWTDEIDGIPIYYRAQVDVQIALTGASQGRVTAIVDGEERHYQIERDDALIAHWVEESRIFWHRHVVPRDPPEPKTADEAERFVKGRWKHARKGFVRAATPEAHAAARELREVKEQLEVLADKEAVLKARLQAMCGEAEGIEGICTWREVKEARITPQPYTRSAYRSLRLKGDGSR